ncbi:MAG TPA: hypothetical protein VFL74_03665 [Sphingomicrobium sp.]|jgi:hypothetical protein|nr:hypothetical protein [Sphingomicrobium sp.]
MLQALIAVVAVCVLVAMSLRANTRFSGSERLPMQWTLSGSVNWTAPRAIALAFTPATAAVVLTVTAALTTYGTPRPGQEGFEIPVMLFVAIVFVGVHWLHLRLIARSLGKRG